MKKEKITINKEQLENARWGYQVAAGLSTFYGEYIWSMFNAMLMANSVVVAGITFVLTSQTSLVLLKLLLPIIGILLCISWFLLAKRGHEYSKYYTLSAREIEELYLNENVNTLSRGGLFGMGQSVHFQIDGAQITKRMSSWGRFIKNETVSYFVIVVFIVIYIGVFFQM